MRGYELDPCPFCGGEFRWHMLEAIGQRMVKGYVKCDGCGCMMGDGLSAEDGEDLRGEIARRVNARRGRPSGGDGTDNLEQVAREMYADLRFHDEFSGDGYARDQYKDRLMALGVDLRASRPCGNRGGSDEGAQLQKRVKRR